MRCFNLDEDKKFHHEATKSTKKLGNVIARSGSDEAIQCCEVPGSLGFARTDGNGIFGSFVASL
jgi:hypothetical protein